MPERHLKTANPKDKDYQIKSDLIATIAEQIEPEVVGFAVLDLGKALTTDGLLSIKQRNQLIEALTGARLLHYHEDFSLEYDELADPDSSLDGIRWELEQTVNLQVSMVAFTHRMSVSPTQQAVEVLVSLFLNQNTPSACCGDEWFTEELSVGYSAVLLRSSSFNLAHQAAKLLYDTHEGQGLNFLLVSHQFNYHVV